VSAPHVVVLGGGPAGVGAAYKLVERGRQRVTLVERGATLGGNAGSFDYRDARLDYGSHRLHRTTGPEILADIRRLLGPDLRTRVRRGRIRLAGRWVRFPLSAPDLLLRLDRGFAFGVAADLVRGLVRRRPAGGESFAAVLRAQLGPTICERFYFPYARKLWGVEPEELAAQQARQRVSASSFAKLVAKVVSRGGDEFFYPRRGFGQISEAYGEAAAALGAELLVGTTVERLVPPPAAGAPWSVAVRRGAELRTLAADHVLSTLPLPPLARLVDPPPPPPVLAAAAAIDYRAMVLVYLELDVDRFTTTDAHYFPEESVRLTRLSEPKNYSGDDAPRGRTVLCAELPCALGDEVWSLDDAALGELVVAGLRRVGLPLAQAPRAVFSRRLSHAYPIFRRGYETALGRLETWLESLPALVSYGRQGAFAHDNTHHALAMAYAAVGCLGSEGFDRARWAEHRRVFAQHVVED
jgi:protoporphyrinogen oxidase